MMVKDLSREQLIELKQNYLSQLEDSGELEELTGKEKVDTLMLIEADNIINDNEIFYNYEDTTFSNDYFFCSMESQ